MPDYKRNADDIAECGNCEFYKESGARVGNCLRYPPSRTDGVQLGSFVGVRWTWWCGEFRPIEDDETDVG